MQKVVRILFALTLLTLTSACMTGVPQWTQDDGTMPANAYSGYR